MPKPKKASNIVGMMKEKMLDFKIVTDNKIRFFIMTQPPTNFNQDALLPDLPLGDGQFSSRFLKKVLRDRFGFSRFRPHQEDICGDLVCGNDVIVVMPTGAGKSLCYQLPGIALGGTTIVISPLISLMEDQVKKLQELGINAERIHSGMERLKSQQVCRDYLTDRLEFLFIAPERLKVPGFIQLLSRKKPSLIAIDEAHCISHWGHDFRPDYRMIGERLPLLMPTPVIALTATATPIVQRDIATQLNLIAAKKHIYGFRRDNIAIEIIEQPQSGRIEAIKKYIQNPSNRPAIIYTPTRKACEDMAHLLNDIISVRPYHAGLLPQERSEVQRDFFNGTLKVITATTAFGMGVDKKDIRSIIHMALPSSIEAYYQEIGRAGRDGKLSRAIMFFSYSDQNTHEYFFNKNYPDINSIKAIYNLIPKEGAYKSFLQVGDDPESLDIALEKLWIHRGVEYNSEEFIVPIKDSNWAESYQAQKQHKYEQLKLMVNYARGFDSCRMLQLINHFGDRTDEGTDCELCDVCAPHSCQMKVSREPKKSEVFELIKIREYFRSRLNISLGKAYKELSVLLNTSRQRVETFCQALVNESILLITDRSFVKDGNRINYKSITLTPKGVALSESDLTKIKLLDILSPKKAVQRRSKDSDKKTPKKSSKAAGEKKNQSENSPIIDNLKKWRSAEAKRRKLPPFCIVSNKVISQLAKFLPTDKPELLNISGISNKIADKYGPKLLAIIENHNTSR